MADILNRLLNRAVRQGLIDGVKVRRHDVCLSHLEFADDMLLFSAAKVHPLVNLRRILGCFSLMSGLKINFEKSGMIPINCQEALVEELKNCLGCKVVSLSITYLGIGK